MFVQLNCVPHSLKINLKVQKVGRWKQWIPAAPGTLSIEIFLEMKLMK